MNCPMKKPLMETTTTTASGSAATTTAATKTSVNVSDPAAATTATASTTTDTDKPERLYSLYGVMEYAGMCPVVYEIVERLKQMYRFR